MTDRFDTAEALRQRVLDIAHANPHCSAKLVAEIMEMEAPDVMRLMNSMSDLGELRRHGRGQTLRFTAIKTKTVEAAVMRAKLGSTRGKTRGAVKAPSKSGKKCGTGKGEINNPSKHKPHPNQGGQGCVSGRHSIGASTIWGNW